MNKILIGERYLSRLKKPLSAAGFEPIPVPDNPFVDKRLAGHVDLSVFKADKKTLIVSRSLQENAELVKFLTNKYRVITASKEQTPDYPHDANLCARVLGDHIIHNLKYSDPAIKNYTNKHLIDVRQGYSSCMVCVVDRNAVITSDHGIAVAAAKNGIDVLEIRQGYIVLDGFDTGFIGGASFLHEETVYFTGMLNEHPDFDKICYFIKAHGKAVINLTPETAFDIGGAVVLN